MVCPLTFFGMTTTLDLSAFSPYAGHAINDPEQLAKSILAYFEDIKDLDPGLLSISDPLWNGFTTIRELTITWEVNGCTGDDRFLVTTDLIHHILDIAFRDEARHPFWDLICMYLIKGQVSTRFDHLCAHAHAAHLCQKTSELFFGALDPRHPFLAPILREVQVD